MIAEIAPKQNAAKSAKKLVATNPKPSAAIQRQPVAIRKADVAMMAAVTTVIAAMTANAAVTATLPKGLSHSC